MRTLGLEGATRARVFTYGLFLAVAIAAMIAVWNTYPDDAYITFRIARNFADTGHWQYNLGRQTGNAATSPLWVLLCAGAIAAHLNVTAFAVVATVVCLTASAVFLSEVFRRNGHVRAGLCAGVLVAGSAILAVDHGLEIPLVLALTAGSLWAVDRERFGSAGVMLGLVVIARADMLIYSVLLVFGLFLVQRRMPWRILTGAVGVFAAYAVFAQTVIGSIIPDTLTAKIDQGRSGYWGTHPYLLEIPKLYRIAPFGNGGWLDGAWFLATAVLAIIGLISGWRDTALRRLVVLLVALAFFYVVAYGVVLNVPNYAWYYGVPAFCGLVLAGIGIDTVMPRVGYYGLLTGAVAVALVIVPLTQMPATPDRGLSYTMAMDWLNAHSSPTQSVASLEIGKIGWESPNRRIIDYLGLLSNRAAAKVAADDMLWWASAYQPDYWLVEKPPLNQDKPMLEAPWFARVFREVWADREVVLYHRVAPVPAHR